jgi:hypothetical protein
MTRRRVSRRHDKSERGIALITTILIVTTMALLAGVALIAAAGAVAVVHNDDSEAAALGAADAGVDDIMYRLNANEDTSFELAENIYDYDTAVRAAPTDPPACPTTDTPAVPPGACGWVTVPDSSDTTYTLQYQYSVPANHEPNPSGTATTAGATGSSSIFFDVVGRAVPASGPTLTRAIRVVLSRSTFLNYGYFTNVDTQDPQQYDLDPALPGWPEFGNYGGTGITAWNGATTQTQTATKPGNAYNAALMYCQNYWFEGNTTPDETSQAANAGVTISSDPRGAHSEQSNGYSLNNICTFTKWETGDTFYGPIRTNDVISVDGATDFYGPVVVGTPCNMVPNNSETQLGDCPSGDLGVGTTYTPDAANNDGQGVYWVDAHNILSGTPLSAGNGDLPYFAQPPSYAAPVDLPPSNPNLSTQAQAEGCVYEGMTYFDFLSNGTVYVDSPGTAAAVAAGTYTLNSGCGGATDNGIGTVTLSTHPVLYVSNVAAPSGGCLDSTAIDYTFGGLVQSNDYYPGLIASADTGGALRSWTYSDAAYSKMVEDPRGFSCDNGDAWVGGVVSGSVTLGAANNVVVYQNLTYANSTYSINSTSHTVTATGSDVIGLEPTNDVVVYHPVNCSAWTSSGGTCVQSGSNNATNDFSTSCAIGQATTWTYGSASAQADCQVNQIDGAILAFNGEYTAENYSFGAGMGTLTEFGSLSEAYRGRLAGTNIGGGYSKSYVYDPRLSTLSPPSFLPPDLFDWTESTWADVSGQVNALLSATETVPVAPSLPTPTSPQYTVPSNPMAGPAFTSAASTTFPIGGPGSFTVTASGSPTPTLSSGPISGCVPSTLPTGVSFNAASGVLSGTPLTGSAGTYTLCFTATNDLGVATQPFTLTVVNAAPAITSANSTTFSIGSAGTFTVTATGYPAPTLSNAAFSGCTPSTLPSGVTFVAGTGVLAGTPAAGTSGTYTLCINATNGEGPAATQNFTLTVGSPPAITSAGTTTFTVGSAGTFTVTTTGTPTPTLSNAAFGSCTPSLPTGVAFNASTGVLSGTPAAGTVGTYTVCVNANNGIGSPATQTLTLTVNQGPAITSAGTTTFGIGSLGTFTVTATGSPAPTLSNAAFSGCTPSTLPSGVSFTASTGLLSGTPATGTAGTYTLCINANNGVGSPATQTFTLTVGSVPAITSAGTATFTVGSAGSFTVTATGSPTPTLSNAAFGACLPSTLPTGVTFNASTGVLSGTPGAGAAGTYILCINATNAAGTATQTLTVTIGKAVPTVTVTGSYSSSTHKVTFTASVNTIDGITPTGGFTWVVTENGTNVTASCTYTTVGGLTQATCAIGSITASKAWVATATYSGDTNYTNPQGSYSGNLG